MQQRTSKLFFMSNAAIIGGLLLLVSGAARAQAAERVRVSLRRRPASSSGRKAPSGSYTRRKSAGCPSRLTTGSKRERS